MDHLEILYYNYVSTFTFKSILYFSTKPQYKLEINLLIHCNNIFQKNLISTINSSKILTKTNKQHQQQNENLYYIVIRIQLMTINLHWDMKSEYEKYVYWQ